jgi:orotate phosphoribosyltransferase
MSLENLLERPGFVSGRARLLELLRTRAFAEREVTLSSGARSNFYIDCK